MNLEGMRHHPDIPFFRAAAMMVGGTVGVGVFGLPFAFAHGGVAWSLALLALLGTANLVLNLMYGDVVIQTKGTHRLGGYVRTYLGDGWADLAALAVVSAVTGSMLAYMAVGGTFLHALLSPLLGGTATPYAFLMLVPVGVVTFRGWKGEAKLEAAVVVLLLGLFAFLIACALPHASLAQVAATGDGAPLLPYGVILFALGGSGVIPDMREVLGKRRERDVPRAIAAGTAVILLLYVAFAVAVVAVGAPSEEALTGLAARLGPSFGTLASVLGALVVCSCSLTQSVVLQNMLRVDHRVSPRAAWAVGVLVPAALYLFVSRDFISIIGFLGSVMGGAIALLVIACYVAMRHSRWCKEHVCLDVPPWVVVGVTLLFSVGLMLGFAV